MSTLWIGCAKRLVTNTPVFTILQGMLSAVGGDSRITQNQELLQSSVQYREHRIFEEVVLCSCKVFQYGSDTGETIASRESHRG